MCIRDRSIVLRNLYPKINDLQSVFLLIGEDHIETLFSSLLTMMKKEMKNEGLLMRFPTGDDGICVKIFADSKFPALRFSNETKEKDYCNSCDLFIGEAIRLLRYLNSRFNFGETNILKTKSYQLLNRPDLFGCM